MAEKHTARITYKFTGSRGNNIKFTIDKLGNYWYAYSVFGNQSRHREQYKAEQAVAEYLNWYATYEPQLTITRTYERKPD